MEIHLRLVLGEVGILVDDVDEKSMTGLLWRNWQDEPPGEDDHQGIIDEAVAFLAAEAIAFLETSGQFQDPLNCYWRDIRRLEASSSGRLGAAPAGPASRSRQNTNNR